MGCCDSSPERTRARTPASSGHPIMRSLEPGEDWSWCFDDEVAMLIREVTGETQHPAVAAGLTGEPAER